MIRSVHAVDVEGLQGSSCHAIFSQTQKKYERYADFSRSSCGRARGYKKGIKVPKKYKVNKKNRNWNKCNKRN